MKPILQRIGGGIAAGAMMLGGADLVQADDATEPVRATEIHQAETKKEIPADLQKTFAKWMEFDEANAIFLQSQYREGEIAEPHLRAALNRYKPVENAGTLEIDQVENNQFTFIGSVFLPLIANMRDSFKQGVFNEDTLQEAVAAWGEKYPEPLDALNALKKLRKEKGVKPTWVKVYVANADVFKIPGDPARSARLTEAVNDGLLPRGLQEIIRDQMRNLELERQPDGIPGRRKELNDLVDESIAFAEELMAAYLDGKFRDGMDFYQVRSDWFRKFGEHPRDSRLRLRQMLDPQPNILIKGSLADAKEFLDDRAFEKLKTWVKSNQEKRKAEQTKHRAANKAERQAKKANRNRAKKAK